MESTPLAYFTKVREGLASRSSFPKNTEPRADESTRELGRSD